MYLNYVLRSLCTNPHESDTMIIPVCRWGWLRTVLCDGQVSGGARSCTPSDSNTWTQADQAGDTTPCMACLWREDLMACSLTVRLALTPTTAPGPFYCILFIWLMDWQVPAPIYTQIPEVTHVYTLVDILYLKTVFLVPVFLQNPLHLMSRKKTWQKVEQTSFLKEQHHSLMVLLPKQRNLNVVILTAVCFI